MTPHLPAEAREHANAPGLTHTTRTLLRRLADALEAAEARHADCGDPMVQVREWVRKQVGPCSRCAALVVATDAAGGPDAIRRLVEWLDPESRSAGDRLRLAALYLRVLLQVVQPSPPAAPRSATTTDPTAGVGRVGTMRRS